jgi:hypothetical protein
VQAVAIHPFPSETRTLNFELESFMNLFDFELTPRSWTVETPLIMRYFSAGIPPG